MVDYVDYTVPMTTEVLVREEPAASSTPSTREAVAALEPRVRGVIKVIFQNLGNVAARKRLQKAALQQGYSEAEFDAALQCFEGTTFDPESGDLKVTAPEKAASPGGESSPRAFDPSAAGGRLVEELKKAEGGAWTGAELQARFGLTSAVLHRRRKEHRILYWRDARHEFHYPQWQFTPTGALLPGVQEVLQTFRSDDEWRLMSYFLGQRQQLDDRRPLELLRAGEKEKVLAHAQTHAEENTW
jgi:hypothetical protein